MTRNRPPKGEWLPERILSAKQANLCVRLLGDLQDSLEAHIESELLDGKVHDPEREPLVNESREKWRKAEDLIFVLTGRARAKGAS